MTDFMKFIPLVLALAAGVLAVRGWALYKRNKRMLDEYRRKRGDL